MTHSSIGSIFLFCYKQSNFSSVRMGRVAVVVLESICILGPLDIYHTSGTTIMNLQIEAGSTPLKDMVVIPEPARVAVRGY